MKNFLDSLKSDLLDRRMRPVLAVVCVALLGAVAFAVLGGGSSSSTAPAPSRRLGELGEGGSDRRQ